MQVCALFLFFFFVHCFILMLIVRQLLTHLLILFYAKYQFMLSFLIKIPLISLLFIYELLLVGMDGQQVFPYIQSAWNITTGFRYVCFFFFRWLVGWLVGSLLRFVETFQKRHQLSVSHLLFILSSFFYFSFIQR